MFLGAKQKDFSSHTWINSKKAIKKQRVFTTVKVLYLWLRDWPMGQESESCGGGEAEYPGGRT